MWNGSGVKISIGTIEELGTLLEHRRKMWNEIGGCSEDELDIHDRMYTSWLFRYIPIEKVVPFIAVHGSLKIGSGCLWFREEIPRPIYLKDEIPYVHSLYVIPEYRKSGIGTAIIREMVDYSKARGHHRIELRPSLVGRLLYEKLGFKDTSEMRLEIE